MPLVGRVTTYDAISGSFRELSFSKDPKAEPITGLIDYDLFCGEISTSSVTAAALADEVGVTLIDVRETWEAEIASLPGALLIPLATLPDAVGSLDPAERFVVYCHHGIRSLDALAQLQRAGLDARHLEGGIDAWAKTVDPTTARY